MARMRVIVVGGFLGAGKTTLLAQAAKYLASQGKRVGVITNDQAANLVDTHFLSESGVAVEEVAGGCFCCRFEDLERSANNLMKSMRPDVLLSEPVGSCTDISATVLQPIKQKWGDWADLSPFSVLADPRRLQQIFNRDKSSFPENILYIIKKQFEEADCLVINKVDLISADELAFLKDKIADAWRGIKILEMSALKNHGVVEWLNTISAGRGGGHKIIDVDYDTYAAGEAELGWLNTSVILAAHHETNWEDFARELIGRIHRELANRHGEIGHLKLLISHPEGQVIANATNIDEVPVVRNSLGATAGAVSLLVNARACLEPEILRSIIEHSVRAVAGNKVGISELTSSSFRPAYPKPTYRFNQVVSLKG